jgi:hypothetical protein
MLQEKTFNGNPADGADSRISHLFHLISAIGLIVQIRNRDCRCVWSRGLLLRQIKTR